MNYPEPEITITELQIRTMLDDQFPQFSDLELQLITSGWDNFIYRLGTGLLVRVPRRELGAQLIHNEIVWLQKLKNILPVSIPTPLNIGRPNEHYPWTWIIMPWFEGNSFLDADLNLSQVNKLVLFLKKLHSVNSNGAPSNPFRDVPLSEKDKDVQQRLSELNSKLITVPEKIKELWQSLTEVQIDSAPCLIHGDLHPGNIIAKNGEIEAIIDWGDITKGDPATDLACLWMMIEDPDLRACSFNKYGASEATVLRSKGWAIFYGITFLNTGAEYAAAGKHILNNIDSV